ncbi:hypothetical protein SANTM175S_07167 [Streptomyces antimycoticus]
MARLAATDHRYRYSVAWIDLLARGAATGRAVLTRGDHAPSDALARGAARAARTAGLPHRPLPPPRPRPRGAARPHHRRSVQRGLVPQGPAPDGRAPAPVRVLPPPGRRAALEPGVRPGWLRAVPVRRRTRPGGGPAPDRAADRAPLPVLPGRAEALRRGRPRLAVLPCRLDAGAGRPRRACPALGVFLDELDEEVARPADGSTSPRTRGCARSCSRRCTRALADFAGAARRARPALRISWAWTPTCSS